MMRTTVRQSSPQVRKVILKYVILVSLVSFIGCAAPNTAPPQALSPHEWVDEAMAQIDVVETHLSKWELEMDVLSATGYEGVDMPSDRLLQWVSTTNEATRALFVDAGESANRLRRDLLGLWVMTGFCGFAEVSQDRLLTEGRGILKIYRTFIRDHSGETRKTILRRGLGQAIEAIPGPYGDEAVQVVGRIVNPARLLPSHAMFSSDRISPSTRQAYYTELSRWLATNEARLTWNPLLHQFECDGQPCVLPDLLYHPE